MTDDELPDDDIVFDEFGLRWDCIEKARELLTSKVEFAQAPDPDDVLALAVRIEHYITGETNQQGEA